MLENLQLAEKDRVVFERPPLALVVFQLRFSNLPEISERNYIETFKKAIEEQYPKFEPSKQVTVQFDIPSNEPHQTETVQWRFTDESRNWTVVLATDFLTFEVRKYEHFEEYTSRLMSLLSALIEHIRPKVGLRVGLRYINEIRLGTEELCEIVRPEVLGLLSVTEFKKYASQGTQEIALRFAENEAMQIRYGFFPDGGAVQPLPGESAPSGPFYLLDFDASRTFAPPHLLQIEPHVIGEYIGRFHDEIEEVFLWSITDEFRQSLGVRSYDS